jgi:hypothetical protein
MRRGLLLRRGAGRGEQHQGCAKGIGGHQGMHRGGDGEACDAEEKAEAIFLWI